MGLADQQDLRDEAPDDIDGDGAGPFDGDPFGDRRPAGFDRAALQAAQHRRVQRRLDADDFRIGTQRLRGDGDAGNQAAAADRNDDRVERAAIAQDLQCYGSLAGDDPFVVVGMDEGEAVAHRRVARQGIGFVQAVAPDHHVGAQQFRVADLHHGRRGRHHDGRRNAEPGRVIGDTLGVVARRHGDHAAPLFLVRQGEQADQGAALLEGARILQVLELQPDFGAADLGQRARADARAVDEMTGQRGGCRFDVREGYRHRSVPAGVRRSMCAGSSGVTRVR